ncbi:MAG TPA: hypothetical protein VHJ99_17110 [Candidatus Dormibacteraeota bacterium]|nr:hypothetical protein [Candidatus Dormibacteraeota bacterium]
MRTWSTRDKVVFVFAVILGFAAVRLLGDIYLRPLPIWSKLVIAAAGVCVIAAIAIYSRRRARHQAPPR